MRIHQIEALEQAKREVKQAEKFALGLKSGALASLLREHVQEFPTVTTTTTTASPANVLGQGRLEEQPHEEVEASTRMTGTTADADELPRQIAENDLSDVVSVVHADNDNDDDNDLVIGDVQADDDEEESLTGYSIRSHQSTRSSQHSSPRDSGGPQMLRRREARILRESGASSIDCRSGSGSLSSTSLLSITSRDTHPVAAKRSPPSDLDAFSRQEMQDEIARQQETIQACYRALLSVKKNADLKEQHLELKVLFLERKLADEKVLTSSLQTSNQLLKRELQAAFTEAKIQDDKQKMKKMISLHQKEVTMEKHLNSLLKDRNNAVHQNTLLKRMLLQTCHDCRNKLPIRKARKDINSTPQLVSASLPVSEGQETSGVSETGLPSIPPLSRSEPSGGGTIPSRRRPSNTAPKSPKSTQKKVVVQSSVQRVSTDKREVGKSSATTSASASTKKASRRTPPRSRSSSTSDPPAATLVSSVASATQSQRIAGAYESRASSSTMSLTGPTRLGQPRSSTELRRSRHFSSSSIELTSEEDAPPTVGRASTPSRAARPPATAAGGVDHTGTTEEDTSTSTLPLTHTPPTTRTVVGDTTAATMTATAVAATTSTTPGADAPTSRAPPDRQSSGSSSVPRWLRMLGGNKG